MEFHCGKLRKDLFSIFYFLFSRREGFTIFELVLTFLMGIILAALIFAGLFGYRSRTELNLTTKQIAALLREAQSRSMARASSTAWGVHFENSTSTTPFYVLFAGTYATSTRAGYYILPASLAYVTSSLGSGAVYELTFSQMTGFSSASASIAIQMRTGAASATISVASSGAVTY